jgi:hypothetical protein
MFKKNSYFKIYIRRYVPKLIRLLREDIYINLMRMVGKRTNLLTMKEFPITLYGENAFFMYPFKILKTKNGSEEYFAQFYGEATTTDYTTSKRGYLNYTSEILSGKFIKKSYNLNVESSSILPISIVNNKIDGKNATVSVYSDVGKYVLRNLKENRFHYVPISGHVSVRPHNKNGCIVGKPIKTIQVRKTSKKLVLSIFIDGLAGSIFDSHSFDEIMPNTSKYFKKGSLYFNGYSSSNWTLASVATLFSGLYPINHKMYDSENEITIGENYKLISEYFSEAGYLTGQICSNFRKNPMYGYMKGFDRTIYKRNMGCSDVITNAIEHLRAFNGRSNFLWLTLFDTHHFLNGLPDISIQTSIDIDLHDYSDKKSKSVHSSYSKKKTMIYIEELKKIDFYLKILFDYINNQYGDDEVVVSICSDHGQGYIGDSSDMLAEHRIKAPLFFKSSETNKVKDGSYACGVDYLPSLLELSGIKTAGCLFDGVSLLSSNRKSSFSEVIYINDYYRTAMYDDDYIVKFVSRNKILSDKDIDYDNGEYSLYTKQGMIKMDHSTSPIANILIDQYKDILCKRRR